MATKAKRYDRVVLLESLSNFNPGDEGAVVEVYTVPYETYDIEIFTGDGNTKGLVEAVLPEQFSVLSHGQISSSIKFKSVSVEGDGKEASILFSDGTEVVISVEQLYPKSTVQK